MLKRYDIRYLSTQVRCAAESSGSDKIKCGARRIQPCALLTLLCVLCHSVWYGCVKPVSLVLIRLQSFEKFRHQTQRYPKFYKTKMRMTFMLPITSHTRDVVKFVPAKFFSALQSCESGHRWCRSCTRKYYLKCGLRECSSDSTGAHKH